MLKRLLKEPLLHFLILGLGLFLLSGYISSGKPTSDLNRIVVDRDRLLDFMQNRSKIFEAELAKEIFDSLSEGEQQALVDDYVHEEALYREAKALKLDENDYTSRQRLIRQLEFINQGFLSTTIDLSQKELERYLKAHKERYYIPTKITFTHIFFSKDKYGDDKAETLARAKLSEINKSQVSFHAGLSHGDRYLYHRNYVNKDASEISSFFGSVMQKQLFELAADDSTWQGPFRSPYGFHLVMLSKRMGGYFPPLEEVAQRVEQDARHSRLKEELDQIEQAIVESYEVEVSGVLWDDSTSIGDIQ